MGPGLSNGSLTCPWGHPEFLLRMQRDPGWPQERTHGPLTLPSGHPGFRWVKPDNPRVEVIHH
jgi:hypothetical protein